MFSASSGNFLNFFINGIKNIFDNNALIHSFLHYYYHIFFTKSPQILFGSFGKTLPSSNVASILLAIHVNRIPILWLKYEFTCNFTEDFMICTINSKQIL